MTLPLLHVGQIMFDSTPSSLSCLVIFYNLSRNFEGKHYGVLVLAYDVARKEIGAGASPRCLAALLGVAVFVLTDNVVICVFALGANIPFVFPHRDDGVRFRQDL